jgi:hypothetical protein
MLSEMTESRMTACPSESAFTITGSSASAGRRRRTALTASRTSEAAAFMSVESLNSATTRLRPRELDEESETSPGTRATAPSTALVIWLSTASGVAPGKSVRTVMTGRSTLGSSRT